MSILLISFNASLKEPNEDKREKISAESGTKATKLVKESPAALSKHPSRWNSFPSRFKNVFVLFRLFIFLIEDDK